ncbi:MAG: MBL fold metallo-hydrolase [Clostridia bacterium]|nr:MBL fold metallo-hydrolase [Clostridia bacterium]
MIKIKVLGCRGLYPENDEATSGYLISDGCFSLVCDMGSGVFAKLKKQIEPEKVSAIFISHLHFDHIADLGVYNYYLESLARSGRFLGKIKLIIKSCESSVYQSIAALPYFEIINFEEQTTLKISDLAFKFYKMNHPSEDYAVTVCKEKITIGYLGDSNVNENIDEVFKNCNAVICHAPLLMNDWNEKKPHLAAKIALERAKKWGNVCILSHFLPQSDILALRKECDEVGANYYFAEQGGEYIIG